MTVTTTTTRTTYTGNGVTKVFSTAWYFTREDDVRVTVDGVLKTRGTHYTVQLPTAIDAAGSVTFVTAPAATAEVVVQRRVAYVQDTSYRAQGSYSRAAQEDSMDRLGFQTQQLAADVATLAAGGDPGIADDVATLQGSVTIISTTVNGHTTDITALDERVTALEAETIPALSDSAPADVAAAADPGDASTASRANHVHAHGAQALGDGTDHALATETVAGFASPQLVQRVNATLAEQVHIIDWVTTDSTPTQVLTYTPADGTIERVAVEAICVDDTGFAGQAGRVGAVDGLSPDAVHIDYTGDGTTVQFDFPWWTDKADGVEVTVNNVAKVYGTDYSVTLPSGATYGHVRLNVAPTLGQAVVISQASAAPIAIVQRTGGSTVVSGAPYVPAIRPGRDFTILIDASSPMVRVRLRGGNYSTRWRVVLKRLAVALAP